MKDKWINIGYEGDELKPYKEPEEDFGDTKRIGEPGMGPRGVLPCSDWCQLPMAGTMPAGLMVGVGMGVSRCPVPRGQGVYAVGSDSQALPMAGLASGAVSRPMSR